MLLPLGVSLVSACYHDTQMPILETHPLPPHHIPLAVLCRTVPGGEWQRMTGRGFAQV
ncbi:MAG: hypothetical protein KTR33_08720 [Gammaproteobacteria bacterium]|nr:hypothetical protein [Gammaproteobacteria bacterium]